jgi:mono/diheme cytochrome c family protein
MRAAGVMLLGLLLAASAAAQSAGEWRGPGHIWQSLCGYCHGHGVSLPLLGAKLPASAITQITRHGLKAMPAFAPTQIGDAELAALAEWISRAQPPPAAAPPGAR